MNTSMPLENQLLATKFYVPVTSGKLISRPRLTALLDESLKRPLTLISAPAGFGKTTLLSTWRQSLPTDKPLVAWVSLDEEDNETRLFWTYVLTALNMQSPGRFTPLLMELQSSQALPLKYILAMLINLLAPGKDHFLLILDDYQVITEQQVHTTLAYLIEHLPAQLRIIVATRADPPLSLPLLRSREQILEVRTNQLRCTTEETRTFFDEVMGIQLLDEIIQKVTARTEGWLVGLQLLGLSLPERADPLSLLEEVSGDQRYILDYLTEEILRRQPQEVQTFLLSTCILERLTASLCNAIMEQAGSQQILQQLERTNLFVVSLDNKRQWYRYHALFAEALRYRLEQMQGDLVLTLHYRASLWYAEHNQTTQAILHAFRAHQWEWAANLIEQKLLSLISLTWGGAGQHVLVTLGGWLEQLPAHVVASRPRLCLACAHFLGLVVPPTILQGWLEAAEATLTTSLTTQTDEDISHSTLSLDTRQEQENLLGEVITIRAFFQSFQEEDGRAIPSLCQQALTLLSPENHIMRAYVANAQCLVYYTSSINNAVAAIECGLRANLLAQAAGQTTLTISNMGITAQSMLGTGQLHEAEQLIQQAIQLGRKPGDLVLPEVGWPTIWQAEICCEWNQLDEARSLAEEAISLCKQIESVAVLPFSFFAYAMLLHVSLSRGELEIARSALQQVERIGAIMNLPSYANQLSHSTMTDRVRLWLACGELDHATHWAEELDLTEQRGVPYVLERQQMACVYVLLARKQPDLALQRLQPVFARAKAAQRWGHVIKILLLQALAYQMCQEEKQALDALSEAVRLAEPEGYIRSFVDEGALMETVLYRLRKHDRQYGPTPYLDTLLAAFQQESLAHARAGEPTKAQPLPEPLSERELQVLQLLAHGASNQEIAQELVIVIDTVKSHISRIFSKLGVQNRVQAVRQARELGLLGEES